MYKRSHATTRHETATSKGYYILSSEFFCFADLNFCLCWFAQEQVHVPGQSSSSSSSCSARALPLRARTATNPGHAAISAGRYRVLSRLLPRATARYRVRYRVLPRSLPRATAFAIACYFLATACYFFVAPATACYRVLPRATALSAAVLLREAKKNGSYRVLSVLPGSTGFYRVLSCTTACYSKKPRAIDTTA